MIELGKTLREARERKGLAINELAERTRLLSRAIEGLENEDFSKIPAPIYGRGFIKLICKELELDSAPLIESFMALYTGEQNDEPEVPEEPREPITEAEPPKRTPSFAQTQEVLKLTKLKLRIASVILAVVLIIWIITVAARAIYNMLGQTVAETETSNSATSAETANDVPIRNPVKVPPLYID